MAGRNIPFLDLAVLQTLVAVEQTGTLARAADKVGRTQSAVSLQMQRLEEALELELFDRRGRGLVLTSAGEAMLGYAKKMLQLNREAVSSVRGHRVAGQVRMGMSADFEHTWVPKAMARFAESHPKIVVELRVDRNSALQHALARDEIDIALVFGSAAPADPTLAGVVPMAWIASRDFTSESDSSLPLLLLEPPCMFREAALDALETAGRPWRLAVTTPSLGGVWTTALAGMGVTVRSAVALPPGLIDVGARLGLPPLPPVGVRILESNSRTSPPKATLRRLLKELAAELVFESPREPA
jgi:DNA-binding transcriptional LysR family regulator